MPQDNSVQAVEDRNGGQYISMAHNYEFLIVTHQAGYDSLYRNGSVFKNMLFVRD